MTDAERRHLMKIKDIRVLTNMPTNGLLGCQKPNLIVKENDVL